MQTNNKEQHQYKKAPQGKTVSGPHDGKRQGGKRREDGGTRRTLRRQLVQVQAGGIHGGQTRLLDVLGLALGFPMDSAKSLDSSLPMDVLGIEVDVNWSRKLITLCVMQEKAQKWLAALRRILEFRTLSPDEASRMAGRLSFAVSAAANRVGRAFVKPFYAQANAPMMGWRCSTMLMNATLWWVTYLERRVKATVSSTLACRHWICWTDASGAARLIAAVIASPSGIFFARARVPDWIRRQVLPREDEQIGVQEALAVWLLVSSFKSRLLIHSFPSLWIMMEYRLHLSMVPRTVPR